MGGWDFKRYGTIDDPIHKSDLNQITGDYGCLKSFRYAKDERAAGKRESETECNGRMIAGTAAHECIARALNNSKVRPLMLQQAGSGWSVDTDGCRKVYDEEFNRAVAGREVKWFGKDGDDEAVEDIAQTRAEMIAGVLNDMATHVADVVLLEAGFIVKIGGYWCSGHVDLIHRPRVAPNTYALADWKTGKQKPHPIALDHSWESGLYSAAMRDGLWIMREHVELPFGSVDKYMRERDLLEAELIRAAKAFEADGELLPHVHTLGAFPSKIHYVHLQDYPAYKRAGKKSIARPEELAFYNTGAGDVKFKAGERRGPAWYEVRRAEQDIPRLESLLRNVVGTVRMGRFFESIGEKCQRCAFREICLNSGYEVRGDERTQLERALKGVAIDDDGLGNVGNVA